MPSAVQLILDVDAPDDRAAVGVYAEEEIGGRAQQLADALVGDQRRRDVGRGVVQRRRLPEQRAVLHGKRDHGRFVAAHGAVDGAIIDGRRFGGSPVAGLAAVVLLGIDLPEDLAARRLDLHDLAGAADGVKRARAESRRGAHVLVLSAPRVSVDGLPFARALFVEGGHLLDSLSAFAPVDAGDVQGIPHGDDGRVARADAGCRPEPPGSVLRPRRQQARFGIRAHAALAAELCHVRAIRRQPQAAQPGQRNRSLHLFPRFRFSFRHFFSRMSNAASAVPRRM